MSGSKKKGSASGEKKFLEATVLGPLLEFAEDSAKFLRECTNNPGEDGQSKAVSKRDFVNTITVTGAGFVILGLAGFLVKLIHIPVNQILVGAA